MARQWRIEFEGAHDHVLSRGSEKADLLGLGCSSVSGRAGIMSERIRKEAVFRGKGER